MSDASSTSRRRFLKAASLGAVGAALARRPAFAAETARSAVPVPFTLGVASYSLRKFDRAEAIAMIQALRAPVASIKSFHLPYDLSPAELKAAVAEFERAGIRPVSGGNNNIREDTDEHVGMFFEYAKQAGLPMLVIAPAPDVLPRIEQFVKKYDIAVAIHNHGPEDQYFPDPGVALELIGDMDPRVGLCVDVGHTTRTGKDVVQEIADAGPRVLDIHMKDLSDLMDKDSQVIVGEGQMPVVDIFRQLRQMNYRGSVNLEYEIDADDPLPGMKQSFAYMRGVLAGMGLREAI